MSARLNLDPGRDDGGDGGDLDDREGGGRGDEGEVGGGKILADGRTNQR